MELKYLNPKLNRLYNSIQLNLGVKRALHKLSPIFQYRWLAAFDNKIIYPVFRFLNEYLTLRTIYHYGADYRWGDLKSHNLDIDKFNLGYGNLHYSIIRNQRPTRVLCLGSMYGFIPFMMAKACMENRKGHVDFVDAAYDMGSKIDNQRHFYGQGFWKKVNVDKHFSYLLSPKFITFHSMTSEEFAKKTKHMYDYIYFDADHSLKGALLNLKLFWPKLAKGGYLCLHDIHFKRVAEGLTFEHWKAWQMLLKRAPNKLEVSNYYSGLGFIQKTGKEKLNIL